MILVQITDLAAADLRAGHDFYESQESGAGGKFVRWMSRKIASLESTAGIHRFFHGNDQRMLDRKYPYAVFYRMNSGTVVVTAVLDCRCDPQWILNRLRKNFPD